MKKNNPFVLAPILAFSLTLSLLYSCADKSTPEGNPDRSEQNISSGKTSETSSDSASTPPIAKKYQMKSGIITFERTGVIGKNKIIVYFDDFGIKERNEVYNEQGQVEEVKFTDGENMYQINHKYSNENVVFLLGPGRFGTELKFVPEPFTRKEDIEKHQFSKLPEMEILGKKCQAYQIKSSFGDTIFAGWNDLLLYSKVIIKTGETVSQAVAFDENATVDPALFRVPDNYSVKKL